MHNNSIIAMIRIITQYGRDMNPYKILMALEYYNLVTKLIDNIVKPRLLICQEYPISMNVELHILHSYASFRVPGLNLLLDSRAYGSFVASS
jgi:hypothetical protein